VGDLAPQALAERLVDGLAPGEARDDDVAVLAVRHPPAGDVGAARAA
jgi:hypothetical protein